MTYPVTSLTLNDARSCVMQSDFLTQGTVFSIPIVFSWGGSIGPEGFRPSILLLTVIIVMVAIVVVVVLEVGYTIIVIVVVVGVPFIIKLTFVITGSLHRTMIYYLSHQPLGYVDGFLQRLRFLGGWVYAFHQDKASSVRVPVANVTLFSSAVVTRKYGFSPLKPADETNCSFRTIEVERLTTYELFLVSSLYSRSFSWSGVPIDADAADVDLLLGGILST
nr:hypothetical protein [Tanacetum cinerariifolium]